MNEIEGILSKIKKRDEKSGETSFTITLPYNTFLDLTGVIPSYPLRTPLMIGYDDGSVMYAKIKYIDIPTTIHFLSHGLEGIGEALATNIVSSMGDEIFSEINSPSYIDRMSKTKGVSKESAEKIQRKLANLINFDEFLRECLQYGLDYHSIKKIYSKGKDKEFLSNPYIGIDYGCPFQICDEIAQKKNIPLYDKSRISALTALTVEYFNNSGNTEISLSNCLRKTSKLEIPNYFVAETILSNAYSIRKGDGEYYVQTKNDYDNEMFIADGIKRINTSRRTFNIDKIPDIGIKYSESQKRAFELIKTSGAKIVTGGPGTGKTTILKGLITALEKSDNTLKIRLCAPTGNAAQKMSEATGKPSATIHRLLKLMPFREVKSYGDSVIDADVIIVDEASMLGTELMALLINKIKNGALLLLIGDPAQLKSVDQGNVLMDLIVSGLCETVHLSEIYRQKGNSSIISNSYKVNDGNPRLIEDKTFKIQRFDNEDLMLKAAIKMAGEYFKNNETGLKVFSPVRNKKFKSGTPNINKQIKEYIADKMHGESVVYNGVCYNIGDYVLFTKNNYEKGYYNGQTGIITSIQKHSGKAYLAIKPENDEQILIDDEELCDIELSYAITAHKSQGSECDYAIIILPKEPISMLNRDLLYVEITRAKKQVVILSEKDALETCISRKPNERKTDLVRKLLA